MTNRICVLGAGAIGGHIAAKLGAAGAEVSIVARPATVEAVRRNGLRLRTQGSEVTARVTATDDASALPAQDLVITTAKAHALPDAADAVAHLSGGTAPVVYIANGIPWWYRYRGDGAGEQGPLARLDPHGDLWRKTGPQTAIGGVIYSSNTVVAPGVIEHLGADHRLILGEPDHTRSPRLDGIVARLAPAGAEATDQIRQEVWRKLLVNLANSPIGTLTRLGGDRIAADPRLRPIYLDLYREGLAVAAAEGVRLPDDAEARFERMARTSHRSSMLQDMEAGRPLETDAQLSAVQDLARDAGVPTPTLDILLGLLLAAARARPRGTGRAEPTPLPA